MTPLDGIYWKLPRFIDSSEVVLFLSQTATCRLILRYAFRAKNKLKIMHH